MTAIPEARQAQGAPLGPPYAAPVADVLLALETAGLAELLELAEFSHVDAETIAAVLAELGRFASEVIAPTDRAGDLEGCSLDAASGAVTTPLGFKSAYHRYVDAGWGALQFPDAFGGGGLPAVVGLAVQEMLAGANLSLSLNPVLTQSAIELLAEWGTPEQRDRYLPKLLTGEWSGTMELTEPDAGSDLGGVSTRAEPVGDGTWRLSGTKIFITWGDHDLTENIVHLVLARTPGAAPGTRGLSLFAVPKRLPAPGGALGERNGIRCVRLEHKLGINGSPTCEMELAGALGELVGPEQGGLRAMFTMMNTARLAIGAEGPAVGERAFQQALAYAAQRRQGRASGVEAPARSLIIEHPDVRRMLGAMRTLVQASRLVVYRAAVHKDLARHAGDDGARAEHQRFVDLLTPIAKAWSSDAGFAVASTGVQVLGGAGYVEETGMAQRLRDARIAPIYEGTNGIQAIDLVVRKLGREKGDVAMALLDEIASTIDELDEPNLSTTRSVLAAAHGAMREATTYLVERLVTSPDDALAGAAAYLELAGLTTGCWLMARRAKVAAAAGHGSAAAAESELFASEIGSRAPALLTGVTAGAERLAVVATWPEQLAR